MVVLPTNHVPVPCSARLEPQDLAGRSLDLDPMQCKKLVGSFEYHAVADTSARITWREAAHSVDVDFTTLIKFNQGAFQGLAFSNEFIKKVYARLGREIPAAVRHKYLGEAAPAPLSAETQKLRRATDAEQTLAAKKACLLYKKKEAGSSLAKVITYVMHLCAVLGFCFEMDTSTLSRTMKLNEGWLPSGDDEADLEKVRLPRRAGRSTLLPETTEKKLATWLALLAIVAIPPTLSVMVDQINKFLDNSCVKLCTSTGYVDIVWARRFLKRHHFQLYRERPMEDQRLKWDKSVNSHRMYCVFAGIMIKYNIGQANPLFDGNNPDCTAEPVINIDPSHVLSADESDASMRTDPNGNIRVIAPKGRRAAPASVSMRSSKHITVIACTRADGGYAAPYLIVAGNATGADTMRAGNGPQPRGFVPKYNERGEVTGSGWTLLVFVIGFLLTKHVITHAGQHADCPGAHYTFTDTGSVNGERLLEWLNVCVVPLLPPTVCAEKKALLMMDGHKSHLYLPFLERLRELNIVLGLRYPHSSHKTQVSPVFVSIVWHFSSINHHVVAQR
jgi:hypothetical protein